LRDAHSILSFIRQHSRYTVHEVSSEKSHLISEERICSIILGIDSLVRVVESLDSLLN
jgi:hypothetical protein